jgi:hypothetical protein
MHNQLQPAGKALPDVTVAMRGPAHRKPPACGGAPPGNVLSGIPLNHDGYYV